MDSAGNTVANPHATAPAAAAANIRRGAASGSSRQTIRAATKTQAPPNTSPATPMRRGQRRAGDSRDDLEGAQSGQRVRHTIQAASREADEEQRRAGHAQAGGEHMQTPDVEDGRPGGGAGGLGVVAQQRQHERERQRQSERRRVAAERPPRPLGAARRPRGEQPQHQGDVPRQAAQRQSVQPRGQWCRDGLARRVHGAVEPDQHGVATPRQPNVLVAGTNRGRRFGAPAALRGRVRGRAASVVPAVKQRRLHTAPWPRAPPASAAAACSAATAPRASAIPLPAMSNAVPWSTEVRMNGMPRVAVTLAWKL